MTTATIHSVTIDTTGLRLDRALALAIPILSRERIKALISTGEVMKDGILTRDPARKVKIGDVYSITVPPPVTAEAEAQDIALNVIFEDEHLLIVNKPAGLVVHPAAGNYDGTMVNALLHHCAGRLSGIGGVARPGIVHRIDKDTSGLLVVAKTDPTHVGLSRQFAAHTVIRVYTAITTGVPNPTIGRIAANLARSSHDRKKIAIVSDGHGKHAITHYKVIETFKNTAALIEVSLETGRTHQVRVHMASIGHPLLGDPVYATRRSGTPLKPLLDTLIFKRQALHAGILGFVHPITGVKMHFSATLPLDIELLIQSLRNQI